MDGMNADKTKIFDSRKKTIQTFVASLRRRVSNVSVTDYQRIKYADFIAPMPVLPSAACFSG